MLGRGPRGKEYNPVASFVKDFRPTFPVWVGPSLSAMFKKAAPSKPDPLAERLRKIAHVPAEEVTYSSVKPGEKRFERKPTFKAATLSFITGERVDVVVKNVSDTGARVEFMRDVELPDRVLLTEPTLRLKVWAYVIWQTRGIAGLQFVKT